MVNRDDDAAFERVVNTPTRGIGDKTLQVLRARARSGGIPLWRAAGEVLDQLPGRAANAVRQFMELIGGLDAAIEDLPLHEQVDHVLQASGLVEFHGREKGERGQARVENLEELVSASRSYEPEDLSLPALPQFLAEVALDAGERQADGDEEAVQLMTLHSAKGLEFPLVFIAGMEENLFPHRMSLEEPGRLEEERRLCYVGLTRAMTKLYLCFAESRQLHGSETWNAVSRFVRDIPGEFVEEVRLQNAVARPTSYARGGINYSDEGSGTGLALGQRVYHKIFGEGVILNFEGNGAHARVQVNFDGEGAKWLVLQYANLEAL